MFKHLPCRILDLLNSVRVDVSVSVSVRVCDIPGQGVFWDKEAGAKQMVAVVYTGVCSMYLLYVCVSEWVWGERVKGGEKSSRGEVQATSFCL